MRTWTRATIADSCGRCGKDLAVGDPMQVIKLHGVERHLHRCATCADAPVPADLPTFLTPGTPAPDPPVRTIAPRVIDVKARQVGDDA